MLVFKAGFPRLKYFAVGSFQHCFKNQYFQFIKINKKKIEDIQDDLNL